jgi:DNA repair photolyase
MQVKEIKARTILIRSRLPDADYAINPYIGCEFGCLYCYASFMGRFVNEPIANWGNYVYAKTNAPQVLRKELKRLGSAQKESTIFISSVTDPYQGAEAKYKLTRGVLEVLAEERYPGEVGIQTKSSMVLRDIGVLKQMRNVEVGMTVTTTDDALGRFLEVRATQSSVRFSTLRRLHDEGIRTYAFVGPLLPHFRYKPALLDALFGALSEAKVSYIYVEHINLKGYIRERLFEGLKNEPEEVRNVYKEAREQGHREALDKIVGELIEKHGLHLRTGQVLYHDDYMKAWPKQLD